MPTRRALLRGGLAAACAGLAAPALAFGKPTQRIAVLDYGLAQTLLVLGVEPIAMPDVGGWARWVIEPALPASVQNLGADQEINLELLVGLKPDLIVSTPYLDALNPTLERIAPVERLAVYDPDGAGPFAHAEAATRRLAAIVGRSERAEAYLAETAEQFRADRARLQGRPRRPILLATFLDARHVWVFGAKSLWQDALDRLDQPNAWQASTNYWGFSSVGIEALAGVSDEAVLITFGAVAPDILATLAGSALWRALPFVKAGRVLNLPPAFVFGTVPSTRRFSRLVTDALCGPLG